MRTILTAAEGGGQIWPLRRTDIPGHASRQASIDALFYAALNRRRKLRTTLTLDDDLLARAEALTGMKERTALLREALTALIERESARRLARLGGSDHRAAGPARRDGEPA